MHYVQNEEKSMLALLFGPGQQKYAQVNCDCDYDYFDNVIEYDYFAFLTNVIEYKYGY